jgi:hypothetical protein
LEGGKPAPNADRDYLSLTGSIRADIQTLWTISKDGNPKDPVPSLEEYLKSKQVVPIEAERGEDL